MTAQATCPLCNRSHKITKDGRIARHGFRGNSGRGCGDECLGSYLLVEGDLLENAIERVRDDIAFEYTTDYEREALSRMLVKLERQRP